MLTSTETLYPDNYFINSFNAIGTYLHQRDEIGKQFGSQIMPYIVWGLIWDPNCLQTTYLYLFLEIRSIYFVTKIVIGYFFPNAPIRTILTVKELIYSYNDE